jgi:thymidylate kinase
MRGKLIVIYGANNLGKSTQVDLLQKTLQSKGLHVTRIKYPIYDLQPTGPVINAVLREGMKMGESKLQQMYVQNRRDFEPQLKTMLDEGMWVIAEDYLGTGIAWGMVRGVSLEELEEMNKNLLPADLSIMMYGERFSSGKEVTHRNEMDDELWNTAAEKHMMLAERYGWKKVLANQEVEKVQTDIVVLLEENGLLSVK